MKTVWYYSTVRDWAFGPNKSGVIAPKPLAAREDYPVVVLSVDPVWDRMKNELGWDGKKTRRLSQPETSKRGGGLIRLKPTLREVLTWGELKERSLVSPATAKALKAQAELIYADIRDWRFSRDQIQRADWGEIAMWNGRQWVGSDDPLLTSALAVAIGVVTGTVGRSPEESNEANSE